MTPGDTGLAAALTLGFLGSSHCLVMCGGISAALGMGSHDAGRLRTVVLFQAGRVLTYAILGSGLGALVGSVAVLSASLLPALRITSGLLLMAMGVYLAGWWQALMPLERLGHSLWRRIEPAARRRLPVNTPGDALAVGMFWGFLPCGLVYTALAWSATAGDWWRSALLMALFGLGTAPAMLATGLAAQRLSRLLRSRGFRSGAALLLIGAGVWTAWTGYQHASHPGEGQLEGRAGAPQTLHHH